ncbi:MAG TPA: hypothetical protein VGR35_19675 [Tepidisphaeraceae bacterium]|nr:hypothetical protein [Tepidisphaeraceae bacterium]
MRRTLAMIAILLMGVSSALAAPANPAPATRPATEAGERDMRPRVLVLPFDELGDAPRREWIGKAMQQSLMAELTRSGMVSVVTPPADAPPANDAAAAAKLARDQHAALAILGSYQLVGEELRITGQMIESIDGEHIAAIKATGNLRDLFSLEDMIGSQVRRDLLAILQPHDAQPAQQPQHARSGERDPFRVEPSGPVQQRPPRGAYNGSDLQRSLYDDGWTPPEPSRIAEGRERYRYDYPAYYYPSYSYYDWCGYQPWRPSYGRPVVPAGPGPSTPLPPNNNYNTHPGQMGRPSGNTNYITTPGQMNRPSGNTNYNTSPGQMNRPSGNTNYNTTPGQMGRSSGGNSVQRSPGQSGRSGGGNTLRDAKAR